VKIALIALAAVLMPLAAQEIKLPANFEKLAAKADETVDVSLDGSMLRLAGRFLSDKDETSAKTKNVLSGLQSITVKSFSFAGEGQYDKADVDAVRAQVQGPQWSRIVGVTSKKDGENADVYFKDGGNGNLGGIVIISAEPKELTIVSIAGIIDPSQLADLGGQFGVPKLNLGINIRGKKGEK